MSGTWKPCGACSRCGRETGVRVTHQGHHPRQPRQDRAAHEHRRRRAALLLAAAAAVVGACLLLGGSTNAGAAFFPFVLPWNDSAPCAFDLTSWNGGAIGPTDQSRRVVAGPDGHYSAAGARIRFLGVNFSSLPAPEESRVIARRMAKFGVNFVRLHALDAAYQPRNLFGRTWGERMIDPEPAMLARLDALVAAFADSGIYVELTLLTGRDFSSTDGLPAEIDSIADFKTRHALGFFYAPILELQKSWARALLDRRNTVREVRYADDPAVAMVEINNENGLVHAWLGDQLDGLPDVFVRAFTARWNALLKSRYGSHAAFAKALGLSSSAGAVLVDPSSAKGWEGEFNGSAKGSSSYGSDPKEGALARIDVTATGEEGWHAQLSRPGIAVHTGRVYTLSFAARASTPRKVAVALAMAHDPWSILGLWKDIEVGTEWRHFQFLVSPSASDAEARLLVSELGLLTGSFEIAGTLLREGGSALGPEENLDKGSIALPRSDGAPVPSYRAVWLSFLYDVDREYWNIMYRFLKKDLGARFVVIGTAVFTATPLEMAALDGVDTHTYWRHPEFPGEQWDQSNWFIRNDPMVRDPSGGAITEAAIARVAGKPFVVSEFCEPMPNSFAAEQLPIAAAYAAYQDWDGLLMFAYSPAGPGADDWATGRMADFFDVANNPLSWPYFISAACAFRRADVSPARVWRYGALSDGAERAALPQASAWNLRLESASGLRPADALSAGIAIRVDGKAGDVPVTGEAAASSAPVRSDTGQLTWDWKQGLFTIDAPRSRAVAGFFLGKTVRLGGFSLRLDRSALGFASATLCALKGEPGAKGSISLLTIAATAHNTAMGLFDYDTKKPLDIPTEGARISCRPDFGTGPVMMEGVAATASLRLGAGATRVSVKALDPTGKPVLSVPVVIKDQTATFSVSAEYATVWYQLDVE